MSLASSVKVPQKPGIDNNKQYDFNKEPVKYLTAIYMDHHFSKLDRGLKRVNYALSVIDPLYKKSPAALFHPDKFKHAKIYEIKATLHLLKAMLLKKKGVNTAVYTPKKDKQQFEKLLKKQQVHGKLNAKDMMLFAKLRGEAEDKARKKMEKYFKEAMAQINLALKTDPKSPTVHYQYAKLMRDFVFDKSDDLIEQHLYQAGYLSYKEDNQEGLQRALEELKSFNPKSKYLAKLERLK